MLSPSIVRYLLPPWTASTASTAPCRTTQSTRSTVSKESTRRSERDNAGKQTELAHASMSSSTYTAHCVNERSNRNLLGLQQYCWWCDARRVRPYTALSLLPFFFVHTCGVRVVFGDHGAVDICKSLVCTENHGPLCAVQLFAFCYFYFVSERSGRRKPPAARSAL